MKKILNIAHRGASGYCPENTMAAFEKSIELGATGIETDIHMTSDGHLVLIHDESLQRTAGSPQLVKDVTLEDIQKLDAGSWFDPKFESEYVPTLDQLFELVKPYDVQVNIELKNGAILYPELEEAVVNKTREYEMSDRVIISSFNHYSLVKCKQLAPEIRTGILYMSGLYEPWEYAKRVGADALHAYHYAVTPQWVEEARQHGIAYHPFTVNDPVRMQMLIEAGVAGIITDYPDMLNELLQKAEDRSK